MLRRLLAVSLLVGSLMAGGVVFAQPGGDAAGDPESGTVYAKKTVYDFEEDIVEGQLVKPEGDYLDSRQKRKQSSLIKVRTDFVPEMLKSAEDL